MCSVNSICRLSKKIFLICNLSRVIVCSILLSFLDHGPWGAEYSICPDEIVSVTWIPSMLCAHFINPKWMKCCTICMTAKHNIHLISLIINVAEISIIFIKLCFKKLLHDFQIYIFLNNKHLILNMCLRNSIMSSPSFFATEVQLLNFFA